MHPPGNCSFCRCSCSDGYHWNRESAQEAAAAAALVFLSLADEENVMMHPFAYWTVQHSTGNLLLAIINSIQRQRTVLVMRLRLD